MVGKSSWDQANRRQKLGLVWRIRKKISQIIKDYFYLPFFFLIILWFLYLILIKANPEIPFQQKAFYTVPQCSVLTVNRTFTFATLGIW